MSNAYLFFLNRFLVFEQSDGHTDFVILYDNFNFNFFYVCLAF